MKRLPLLVALSLLPLALPCAAPAKSKKPAASKKSAPKETPLEKRVDALWEASDVQFHKGDYLAAVAIHRQIVKLAPEEIESYGDAAWLLWSLGQKAEARDFIAQGLKANPLNPEMWDTAGQHYTLEHSFADAKDAFLKAIQFAGPKRTPELLRRRLAHAAEDAGDFSLAIQTWTDLVRDYPTSPVNQSNLARAKARSTAAPTTTGPVA